MLNPCPLCPGKVAESSFYIGLYELTANSISDIKTFKLSYQLSFDRWLEEADQVPFSEAPAMRAPSKPHIVLFRRIFLLLSIN